MTATATESLVQLLRRVRHRLSRPEAWTQGTFAGSLSGVGLVVLDADDPAAVCWCLMGAIALEALVGAPAQDTRGAVVALEHTVGLGGSGLTLEGWNDAPGRTHDDVVRVLDLTIARLQGVEAGAAA